MERGPSAFLILTSLGAITLWWLTRRGVVDLRANRMRRGSGHALLGLQGFIEPSVEHVLEAENLEQKDARDEEAGGDDTEVIRRGLSESLAVTPVDPEEVRRHLAAAVRAGLDWREVYDQAVQVELRSRPYRAPTIPPSFRVDPRG